MRTTNSFKRIYREVASCLSRLTPAAWEILWHGTSQEQRYILWLAVCKRYAFIRDFATSVVHEKYLRLDYTLTYLDYDIFFDDKAEWHPEVKRVADSTPTSAILPSPQPDGTVTAHRRKEGSGR